MILLGSEVSYVETHTTGFFSETERAVKGADNTVYKQSAGEE